MQGGAVDLLQGGERRSAFVKVEHVEKEAGVGASGRYRHVDAVRQGSEHRVRAPELEQRLNAGPLAHFERLTVVLRGVVEGDRGCAAGAWGRRDTSAADLRHLV